MSFAFNEFVVDAKGCRLLRDGQEVRLERRTFDLLHYLITHRDRVVSKEELLEQVWGARVLSDGALSNTVAKLRRALGQASLAKQPIETIHGRGYRFHAQHARAEPGASTPPPVAAQLASARDLFVGREALMHGLVQRLQQRESSSESLIVLSGEAGIGKTRTTRELSAQARALGYSVWVGAAYEGAGAPTYWPWIQIFRSAHDELPPALWQSERMRGAWALAQLVPELGSTVAEPPRVEPLVARFQLFDEVSRLLESACEERPRLLILDDLQSADLGTLELLSFVVRALQGRPIMFLATLRTGEPAAHGQPAPLAPLARVATVLRLAGLSADEVQQLASALTDDRLIDPAQARVLHSRTQGNPLFVRQALDLITQRDDWSFLTEREPVAELPPTISHVIRRRLVGLPPETIHALEAAAVIGKSFETPVLAEVCGVSLEQLRAQLDPALRIGLLEPVADAPDSHAFVHVLARDTLLEGLGSHECGELHGRIASALASRAGPGRSRQLGAIAHHALLAVPFELERAIDACRRAAAAAQEASSFEVAAQLRSRAIEKLINHGGAAETHCRLLLELGEDHFYAGLVTSAWRAFRDAAEVARAHDRVDLLAELAPRLVDCLELGVGEPWFSRGVVDQALASPAAASPSVEASLLAQRAELALELPVDERFALLDRAAALAERGREPAAILEVAHSRAILRDPTRLCENDAAARHFLELAERHPEAAAGMRYRSLRPFGAYLTRYLSALTACDLPAADLMLEQCARIAERSHVRAARLGVGLMRAGRALADGRLDDLQRLLPSAPYLPSRADGRSAPSGERAEGCELPSESDAWTSYFGALLEARGNLDKATLVNLLSNLSTQPIASKHRVYVLVGRARLLARLGEHERVRALLGQMASSELERLPVQYGDLDTLCALAEIAHAQADKQGAAALYPRLDQHAARNAVGPAFEYRGAVAHFAGLLATTLQDEQAARRHFQRAIEINRLLRMPSQLALSEAALRELTVPGPASSAS